MSNIQTNWYLYQYSALNLTENGKISISTSLTNWYIILGNQQKKKIAWCNHNNEWYILSTQE
jgi:hypothetical protein